MKSNKRLMKSVATTVMVAQLGLALQPLMAATRDDKGAGSPMAQAQLKQLQALQRSIDEAKAVKAVAQQSPADRASTQLARVEELVRDLVYLADESEPGASSAGKAGQEQVRAIGQNIKAKVRPLTDEQKAQRQARRAALWDELKGLLTKQSEDQAAVRAEFAQTRKMLVERKLPAVILGRHDEAVKQFEQRVAQFNQSVAKASTDQKVAVAELKGFFDQYPTKRRPAPSDPKNLPWRTPEPTKRMPAETQTAWFQNLYGKEGTRLAQVGNNLAGLEFITPPEPGAAPTAADLAETPETQRTSAIVAKAQELGNNPVNIQNWVRNNVEWVPTWGAIQSAEDTLNKKRGNAIDIASLEIALLRAAKIPARYQFGTIELPSEQVMNWVGGVQKPEAAQQLLGQGGIANRGLIEGGKISKIRMEHAWVQAYVNWVPSRGAKQGSATQHPNPLGLRNAWVPLDASDKNYVYPSKATPLNSVPIDAARINSVIMEGASRNDSEGWVQSFNQAGLSQLLDEYKLSVQAKLAEAGNPSVRDQVARRIVSRSVSSVLAGGGRYQVVSLGAPAAALPDTLAHKFSYELYAEDGYGMEGTQLLAYREKTSQLTGRRITLTYSPATEQDRTLIASYMPKLKEGQSQLSPSDFPSFLPGYLIKVIPEIRIDGQIVAKANSVVSLGDTLVAQGGFTSNQDLSRWDITSDSSNIAGQTTAIGVSAGGLSEAQMLTLRTRLSYFKTKSDSGDYSGLSAEQYSGDMLTAMIWSWFATADAQGIASQALAGVVENPGLSYGLVHAVAVPMYSWGVVTKVKFPAVNMDIGHVRYLTWAMNGDAKTWVAYNKARGASLSALEHVIPDRFFNDPTKCYPDDNFSSSICTKGVSAVRALEIAAQQGQKIYNITQDVFARNPSIVQEALSQHSVSTRSAVQQALYAGQEVVIHEAPITVDGWRGAGYTALDPSTGAGGYMIEGGSNGAWKALTDWIGANPGWTMLLGLGLLAFGSIGALLSLVLGLISLYVDLMSLLDTSCNSAFVMLFGAILIIPVLIGLIFGGVGWIIGLALGGYLAGQFVTSAGQNKVLCP